MGIAFDEASISGRHTIEYQILDYQRGNPTRKVDVLATPAEIEALVKDGYLVRPGLLPMDEVEKLRIGLDEAIANDKDLQEGGASFGGTFIRRLMDKHPAFLGLLNFPPTLSVARAVLGPSLRLRGLTGRVCYPDAPNQETEWHFHQRVIPNPLPPMFSRPHLLDVLIYLDDITELNGPLCVLPGSHNWTDAAHEGMNVGDMPGQVVLTVPAGSCVMTHGSLWHRALPTLPGCTMRRLLILSYGPCWIRHSIYGKKPAHPLTETLLENADAETRELLGVDGYM